MTTDQLLVIAGLILTALAILIPLRYSMRKDETERTERQNEAQRSAIKDAVKPVADERDYWRARADRFEDELRARERSNDD